MSNRVYPWFLGFLHAALFALAFPPFDLWFLAFVAPAPLAHLAINATSTRRAVVATYVTQFILWLWLVRWITPVTAVGYPFLALYMSIWPTVFVWIVRRTGHHRALGQWPMSLLLPIIWVGVEFFRGDVLFHGYPWYLLGHPLIAISALVQSADLFGTYFTSFLAAIMSGAFVDLLRARAATSSSRVRMSAPEPSNPPRGRGGSLVVVVIVIFATNFFYGRWRMNQADSLSDGPRILAIQTNLPQDNKTGWSEEERARDLPAFMALTRQAVGQSTSKPDLIVWPETMVPGIGFEPQTDAKLRKMNDEFGWDLSNLNRWPTAVAAFQREIGIPMIVGSEAWIEPEEIHEGTKIRLEPKYTYNSAYLIDGEPPYQRYDKFFLTPFGETMPYISAWPWLERQFLTIGVGADLAFNLDSNPDIKRLQLEWRDADDERSAVQIATPVCFEDTVARFCRRMIYDRGEKRGDMFINISNDGWFGSSVADRKLHAQIARFRCIENRVPMIRSVNTGLSVWIDSAGRIKAAAGADGYGRAQTTGWVLAEVQVDSRRTLYGRLGELWPVLCLAAAALMLGWSFFAPRTISPN